MGVKVISRPPDYAKAFGGGLAPVMRKAAMYLQSSANKKINGGISPANKPLTQEVKGGGQTLRDRGDLAMSITPHSGDLWADASTNLIYARIQQEGGTVTPKNAKALWIPASARVRTLMRSYGQSTPRGLIAVMEADGYKFFKPKSSKIYWAKKGKRGKEFPLFIIRKSVKIPPRPFLYIDDQDETYILGLFRDGVAKALK